MAQQEEIMKYFAKFPKVYYSFDEHPRSLEVATDITFPVHLLEKYAEDSKYYYTAVVKDGLRPEDVAFLIYGDVEKHWIVLHFNKIINPLFTWPLSSLNLDKYIEKKYGSIGVAQQQIAKYYKIIKRISSISETPTIQKIEIGATEYANVPLDLAGTDVLLNDGEIVKTIIDRETISVYDYEVQQNDLRREIRLIQTSYIDNIISSLDNLVKNG
jgi:hypothetical protein